MTRSKSANVFGGPCNRDGERVLVHLSGGSTIHMFIGIYRSREMPFRPNPTALAWNEAKTHTAVLVLLNRKWHVRLVEKWSGRNFVQVSESELSC